MEEGASSDRWLLYSVVIDDILSGENLLGGLDPNIYTGYTFFFITVSLIHTNLRYRRFSIFSFNCGVSVVRSDPIV